MYYNVRRLQSFVKVNCLLLHQFVTVTGLPKCAVFCSARCVDFQRACLWLSKKWQYRTYSLSLSPKREMIASTAGSVKSLIKSRGPVFIFEMGLNFREMSLVGAMRRERGEVIEAEKISGHGFVARAGLAAGYFA